MIKLPSTHKKIIHFASICISFAPVRRSRGVPIAWKFHSQCDLSVVYTAQCRNTYFWTVMKEDSGFVAYYTRRDARRRFHPMTSVDTKWDWIQALCAQPSPSSKKVVPNQSLIKLFFASLRPYWYSLWDSYKSGILCIFVPRTFYRPFNSPATGDFPATDCKTKWRLKTL